jgi:hypothetical protein
MMMYGPERIMMMTVGDCAEILHQFFAFLSHLPGTRSHFFSTAKAMTDKGLPSVTLSSSKLSNRHSSIFTRH